MEYNICVDIESDSTATQTRYSIAKHYFFERFAIECTICVGIESDSTATQTRYSIAEHYFFSVLQWNKRFVWVLTRTQQPHKHDIPLQNTIFLAFCNGIYNLCGY